MTAFLKGWFLDLRRAQTVSTTTLPTQSPWKKSDRRPPTGHYPAILWGWAPHAAVLKCLEKAARRAESSFIQFCPPVMSSLHSLFILEKTGFRIGLAFGMAHARIQDLGHSSATRVSGNSLNSSRKPWRDFSWRASLLSGCGSPWPRYRCVTSTHLVTYSKDN